MESGAEEHVRAKTGLKIDSYFSASKLKWLADNHPAIATGWAKGQAMTGTMDTYLIYRLTGGRAFVTDHTNACRTLLYDIRNLGWDDELCRSFGVPIQALPRVLSSDAVFGETTLEGLLPRALPICGVMGDSQAALFAQRCYRPGSTKVTFGTGSSVLVNVGPELRPSQSGIVSTVAWGLAGKRTYALEGIINCTGATITWLKDRLGLIDDPAQTEALAASVPDNGGVHLVPAFVGLGAPYWSQDSRAAIVGLTQHSSRSHIVRAALESIAYQVRDVLDSIVADAGLSVNVIHADGGMVSNKLLMQFVADITGVRLKASATAELSALGAVLAGCLGMGIYGSQGELEGLPMDSNEYTPGMCQDLRQQYCEGWKQAVRRVL